MKKKNELKAYCEEILILGRLPDRVKHRQIRFIHSLTPPTRPPTPPHPRAGDTVLRRAPRSLGPALTEIYYYTNKQKCITSKETLLSILSTEGNFNTETSLFFIISLHEKAHLAWFNWCSEKFSVHFERQLWKDFAGI